MFSSCILLTIALPGAVPLVGEPRVPRYHGPLEWLSREAGRPMGPSTPRCSSQSCAVFVSVILLGIWKSCLGYVKRFVALGFWSSFGCPLSFGPVSFLFCLVLGFLGGGGGCIIPTTVFLGRRGSGGRTDDRHYECCFLVVFFFPACCRRLVCQRGPCMLGMHFIQLGLLSQVFPQAILTCFCFLALVALCFLWVDGVPLAAFSHPRVSGFWVVGWFFSLLPLASCISLARRLG